MVSATMRIPLSDGFSDCRDQLLELRAAELGAGALVLLHAPGPVVEVDVAHRVLDRGPKRPAVLGHHAEQPGARGLDRRRSAEISLDEMLEPVVLQRGFAPDV